MSKQKQNY